MDVNKLYLMKSVPSSHWFLPRDHRETHVANAFDQCITKVKLLELTTQQPNKLRDYLLGKNSDLFRKPGDQKDVGLLSQRIIFAGAEFGFLLHEKISIASLQIWTYCSKGTHSSTLAWKIPWTEEPGRLQSMGLLRVGHDCVTSLSLFTFMHWRRKWQPTPVFLPGESQGWESLVGCHLWGHTESDTTEVT